MACRLGPEPALSHRTDGAAGSPPHPFPQAAPRYGSSCKAIRSGKCDVSAVLASSAVRESGTKGLLRAPYGVASFRISLG